MPDALYVAWQDGSTRRWHTIGRLTRDEGDYLFVFTKGISGITGLARSLFSMDSGDVYRFKDLIPLFKNRMLPLTRADYGKVANWVGILPEDDEFARLCKFGLIPGTDSMMLYPAPELESGRYKLKFFVHALKYMHDDARSWCEGAGVGARLCALLDVQNPADPNAVALKCPNENILVGYVPSFYAADLKAILSDENFAKLAEILVSRNNIGAPDQLKLMCEIATPIPEGFVPLDTNNHKPHIRPDAQIVAFRSHNRELAGGII